MPYAVRFKPSADKEIKSLPAALQQRVVAAIDKLAENPRPRGCKKVKGPGDLWRICVGDYRVIYAIADELLIVTIVRVAHRKDVYRP